MARPILVTADWDHDAGVWVATTRDLPGLITEGDTIEILRAKLPGMVLDMLEEHGIAEVPVSIEIIARVSEPMAAVD
jgi:predicted RNase H-like HicB family nuclease